MNPKIVNDYPPNYEFLLKFFNFQGLDPCFAYENVIYSPHHKELPPDLILHEQVHFKQQKAIGSSDIWYQKYCEDVKFRLDQEVEAYSYQYNFLKKIFPKQKKRFLNDIGNSLSGPIYGNIVSKSQAETLVRLKSKELSLSN